MFQDKYKENGFLELGDCSLFMHHLPLYWKLFCFEIFGKENIYDQVKSFKGYHLIYHCNAVTDYTTGFVAVSIFILDCWNMINFHRGRRHCWIVVGCGFCNGMRHSLCDAHLSNANSPFRSDQR